MAERFDDLPPFDVGQFEQDYSDAPELMNEIFSIFVEETPDRLEMLEEGIREGDAARVKKAAHSLANTTGTLGAKRALTLARQTEAAARGEDYELMQSLGEALAAEIRGILQQVDARLDSGY
jgi:HPt (histidine-containing phosphotransfer) domain-containing protein